MKKVFKERSFRILMAVMLGLMMVAGGVLPNITSNTYAAGETDNASAVGSASVGYKPDDNHRDSYNNYDRRIINISIGGKLGYCIVEGAFDLPQQVISYDGTQDNLNTAVSAYISQGSSADLKRLKAVLYYGYGGSGEKDEEIKSWAYSTFSDLDYDPENPDPDKTDITNWDSFFRAGTQYVIWKEVNNNNGYITSEEIGGSKLGKYIHDTIFDGMTPEKLDEIDSKVQITIWKDTTQNNLDNRQKQNSITFTIQEGPSISNTTLTADGSTAGAEAAQVEIPSGSTSKSVALTDNVQWAGLDVSEGKTYIIKCELYNTESTTTPVATAQESGINQASGTKTVTFTPNVNLSEGTYSIKTTIYASDGTTKVVGPHNDNLKDKKETVEVTKAPGPTITPAKLKFTAQKSVIDADNDDADITANYVNKFEFSLEQTEGPAVLSQPQVKKNASSDGKTVTFDEITFDESIFETSDTFDTNGKRSKTFTFKVSENAGNEADIQYSTESLTKQVTVTETRDSSSGDCTFSITIDGTEGTGTVEKELGTLTNTKKTVTPIKIRLVASKAVAGTYAPDISEVADKFNFTLSGGGQNQTGKKNDVYGNIAFDPMTLNVGKYVYKIAETAGDNGGITYHSGTRNITVNTKEDNGSVVIQSAKMGMGENLNISGPDQEGVYTLTLPEGKEFTNTYKDPKVTNTTATANGTVATDDGAATVTMEAGEEVNVTLTDSVEFESFDADRNYVIVSELYKDGTLVGESTKNTPISGKSSGTETVTFDNLTDLGNYDIKTKVYYAKADDATKPDFEKPIASATHNDELNINKEKVEIKSNLPKIKISKSDLGGAEIEGAEMKLYKDDSDNPDDRTLVKEWTSSADGPEEFELEAGDYVLKEVIAPNGYAQVSTDMKFTVNADGSVTLNTAEVDSGGDYTIQDGTKNHIVLKDAPAFDIKISKNVLGGSEVPGAKMKLEGGPDNLTAQWISTGEPEMFKVREGSYILTEEVAPAGLQRVTTKMEFTVDAEGKVTLTKATADNGGSITVKEGTDNHIVLEDAPITPDLSKTVNGAKTTTLSSKDEQVEFKLTAKVPYGAEEFIINDPIPAPLLYVDGTLKATLGGKNAFSFDPDSGQFGFSDTDDHNVNVTILSPTEEDGTEGVSSIKPEDAWGKEVVVTFKCKLDPEADLKKYKDTTNIAFLKVDGKTYDSISDNTASVLGIYELADEDLPNVNPDNNVGPDDGSGKSGKNKSSKTGDESPLAVLLIALLSSAAAAAAIGRRRLLSRDQ